MSLLDAPTIPIRVQSNSINTPGTGVGSNSKHVPCKCSGARRCLVRIAYDYSANADRASSKAELQYHRGVKVSYQQSMDRPFITNDETQVCVSVSTFAEKRSSLPVGSDPIVKAPYLSCFRPIQETVDDKLQSQLITHGFQKASIQHCANNCEHYNYRSSKIQTKLRTQPHSRAVARMPETQFNIKFSARDDALALAVAVDLS
ncbi:hypothetical protein J6590_104439 [Homalodisca vitripennis]|nr:hypothetical protein J6590_104439 [Homalodisca vitripennis]